LNRSSILIISDDPEFARAVATSWQAARQSPEITLATSDVVRPAAGESYALVIVGPLQDRRLSDILSELEGSLTTVTICIADDEKAYTHLEHQHPHVVFLPRQSASTAGLIALSNEAIRRVDAVRRAQRAERLAIANQSYATLGRYMLEMRSSVNNALTSVLGNADLLLLDRAQMEGDSREQIQAIHAMALRLNEIMQRFSSLMSEIRLSEKESQAETDAALDHMAAGPRMSARRV
jgi:signal transduction histidine kinase